MKYSNMIVITLSLSAFIATLLLTPVVRLLAAKFGAVETGGGYRKINLRTVPLLGGLAIAIPFVLIAGLLFSGLLFESHVTFKSAAAFLVGCCAITLLGVVDDIIGVSARIKLLGQVAVGLLVVLSGFTLTKITLPLFGTVVFGGFWGGVISLLWIVGLVNAFNLIDGVDGLASGIALIASVALAILAMLVGNHIVMLLFAVLASSLLAFLFFNFYPAKIFLGDTGSMFLGYCIAMLTLIGAYKYEAVVIVFAPLLVLGVPIFETLVSMLRRYIHGNPIFSSDNRHTHHRLLSKGYSQRQVALLLYFVAFLLACWAILSRLLPAKWSWLPWVLFGVTLLLIAIIAGYLTPNTMRAVVAKRQRNVILVALAKYLSLSLSSDHHNTNYSDNLLFKLCHYELHLNFLRVLFNDGVEMLVSGACMDESQHQVKIINIVAATGEKLTVEYQIGSLAATKLEEYDVAACLAAIFSGLKIDRVPC